MNARILAGVLSILLLAGPLAGCLGWGDEGVVATTNEEQEKVDEILGEKGRDDLLDAAAVIPKNWSMPDQKKLPPVVTLFTGKVDTGAVGSYEAERDEGGIDYRGVVHTYDISPQLPAGQPAEVVIDLFWDASEVNSADLDIVVDVPGTKTSYSPVSETMNWNHVLKTMVVNTIGVSGQPALVGVQISSGMVTQGFDYELEVTVTYVEDVLTPHHAWALEVPSGAGAIILESVKAGGDEHIRSEFIVLDPEDNLVKYVMFDDINIPTQSVLVPVTKSGTYVFYAYYMHGGFLRVKADVPLDQTVARPLALAEEEVVLTNQPSPGVGGKDYGAGGPASVPTDDVNAVPFDFAFNDKFPVLVSGFVRGQVVADSKVTLSSPKGVAHTLIVKARYQDESGTIGYTSDHEGRVERTADGERVNGGVNNLFDYANVDKGSWTASVVNNGPSVEVGYRVLTVVR